MHYKLDVKPIPEKVLYINELDLSAPVTYRTIKDYEKALENKTISNGVILPDDNVRIYVPMNLNAEEIMQRLELLYLAWGSQTEGNESLYSEAAR